MSLLISFVVGYAIRSLIAYKQKQEIKDDGVNEYLKR
jgi:hypothetical protein